MYYSKSSSTRREGRIIVPENYSGNTFRVKDESTRRNSFEETPPKMDEVTAGEPLPYFAHSTVQGEPSDDRAEEIKSAESTEESEKKEEKSPSLLSSILPPKSSGGGLLSSLLHDIDVEEIIILGLLLVLWRDDTDDDVLLLLIILLFLK